MEERKITALQSQGLDDVIDYAVQQQKTGEVSTDNEGEVILQQFVSGVNCHRGTAREELLAVLEQSGLTKERDEVSSLVEYIDSMEEKLGQLMGELQEAAGKVEMKREQLHEAGEHLKNAGRVGELAEKLQGDRQA